MQIKKGFTLIELLIVVFIISISYTLVVNIISVDQNERLSLKNLKERLAKERFSKSIKVTCIEREHRCYKSIDGELDTEHSFQLFASQPTVYKQVKQQRFETISFDTIRVDDFYQNVEFEFSIKKGSSEELVVEYGEKFYYYKSLKASPYVFETLNQVDEMIRGYRDSLKVATSAF